jgi:hypothetical protein
MQSIEFKTVIHNGSVTIPAQYSPQWEGKTIRVIVLEDCAIATSPLEQTQQPIFSAIALTTQGFQFNRDEANER